MVVGRDGWKREKRKKVIEEVGMEIILNIFVSLLYCEILPSSLWLTW